MKKQIFTEPPHSTMHTLANRCKKQATLLTIVFLTIITITAGGLIYQSVCSARNKISHTMKHALEHSIEQDREKRSSKLNNTFTHIANGKTLAKELVIITGNEEKQAITFGDSINIPTLNNMRKQHTLKSHSAIQADSLSAIFESELHLHNIHATAGIVIRNGEKTFYSKNDSTGYRKADFVVRKDSIDPQLLIKVEGWAVADTKTILHFMGTKGYAGIGLGMIAIAGIAGLGCYRYRMKKKAERENRVSGLRKRIILQEDGQITIDGTPHKLAQKDYELLKLFVDKDNIPLPHDYLHQLLWKDKTANNVCVHINRTNPILESHGLKIVNTPAGYLIKSLPQNVKANF